MNTLDLLLNIDENKLKIPDKEVEIKRLSDLTGEKIVFKIQAVSMDKYISIAEQSQGETGDVKIFTLIAGVKEPSLKNKDLMSKYGCVTPKDLVKKLLLPGEITKIYNEISQLSGFNIDAVTEIKNS